MSHHTGGCLCGALRYEITAPPLYAGFCCCRDCRRVSGAGCTPFIGVAATAVRLTGAARQTRSTSIKGTEAVRNFCPSCGSLVFGGEYGKDTSHTIYAGSLDDVSVFQPTIAIFVRDRPAWCILPPNLTEFQTMPGQGDE
jgi:hypothetical protein